MLRVSGSCGLGVIVSGMRARLFASFVVALVWGAAFASCAFAAPTWYAQRPAVDGMATSVPTQVSVTADHTINLVKTTGRLAVDGSNRIVTYTVYDNTHIRMAAGVPSSVAQDGAHTVSARFEDAQRVVWSHSWTFTTAIPPTIGSPSPAQGALVTSTSFPIKVPVTDNSLVASWEATVNGQPAIATLAAGILTIVPNGALIDDAVNSVQLTVTDGLGLKTSRSWSFFVQVSPEMAGVYCTECHSDKDVAGHTYNAEDCQECHYSDPHAGTPSAIHPRADVDACRPCHVSAITVEHAKYGLTCVTCHVTSDPVVTAAVQAGQTACASCHAGSGSHEAQHEVSVPGSCAGSGCHAGASLTSIHLAEGSALTCDSCHESTNGVVQNAIASGDRNCSTCHPGDSHASLHEIVVPETCAGAGCHAGTNLADIHVSGGCSGCHDSADLDVAAAISTGTTACSACHSTEGIDYHSNMSASHASPTTTTCFGAGCHDVSRNLPSVHALYAGPGTVNPEYPTTCALCHANPGVNTATSGASCTTACHASPTHTGYHDGHAVTVASTACTDCHTTDLTSIHGADVDFARCAVCHGDPANGTKNADCASCHAGVDHEADHAVVVPTDCESCHAGTSLIGIHATPGCAGCHDSTTPAVVAAIAAGDRQCATCHGTSPHPDIATAHQATMTSGTLRVHQDHYGWTTVDWDIQCSMCHASAQLLTVHAQDCAACHSGSKPASSFTDWNGSCSQGACHPSLAHDLGPASHEQLLNTGQAVCESCHDGDDWSTPWENCQSCHVTATNGAPVTTSNAQNEYTGTATITLSSPGVAYTFYRLDGAAKVGGTVVTVPAPATGTASHTLEFWSVDDYGNEETPHKTKAFTVSAP